MKVLIFSAKDFEIPFLEKANTNKYAITFLPDRLTSSTADKAIGYDIISIFSADEASAPILEKLSDFGVKLITLRSKGYDNVNLKKAAQLGIQVTNVPDYSANSVAEHAIALMLGVNRKLKLACNQLNTNNFSLANLVGFDVVNKKCGVIGTGKIGKIIAQILEGFGAELFGYDLYPDYDWAEQVAITYTNVSYIYKHCDLIFLATPLTTATHYMINADTLQQFKKDAVLINIARGAVVRTEAILKALEKGKLGAYATDVYEHESGVFFYDLSGQKIDDPLLDTLLTHPKVLLTPHQAFATKEALQEIAEVTFKTIDCWEKGLPLWNQLTKQKELES
ncbi:2-hydroxyacid dehydrogenase [Aquimarina brevivitae]|uniref:D-lactate dehydrogenase n=1 Tax=Aquimarina brevivitae TaxID=323412 RepID=A0A4Q7PHR0_9FLAO|nr:2-hydroxyacid dehydrogenase [Aquimarina brevivitae]RZS99707.1 D-lactate dehydrogenase [Aquimarina brevivitae]